MVVHSEMGSRRLADRQMDFLVTVQLPYLCLPFRLLHVPHDAAAADFCTAVKQSPRGHLRGLLSGPRPGRRRPAVQIDCLNVVLVYFRCLENNFILST